MYYKYGDLQYGGVAILFQWPFEVLQPKTPSSPKSIFPIDGNAEINTCKAAGGTRTNLSIHFIHPSIFNTHFFLNSVLRGSFSLSKKKNIKARKSGDDHGSKSVVQVRLIKACSLGLELRRAPRRRREASQFISSKPGGGPCR